MRYLWMSVLAVLLAGTAWAHGDHDTGKPRGAEEKQSWWLDLVPRAAAAQQMEIDERQGVRFVRADGLPNHATGAFPNRSNPNRIAAQSYYFRMPLRPVKAGRATYYRPNHLFGVATNGVVFDPNTAEFWNDDRRSGWMIEALSGGRPLGIDHNNAHVQPGRHATIMACRPGWSTSWAAPGASLCWWAGQPMASPSMSMRPRDRAGGSGPRAIPVVRAGGPTAPIRSTSSMCGGWATSTSATGARQPPPSFHKAPTTMW
jgi:hypothetical protein